MSALVGSEAQALCMELLYAPTEADVIDVLKAHGLWDDRTKWTPYGNMPNNRGVVGNQQSHPVAALVEKLVNSVDSILIAECVARGVDPRGPDAPNSMADAIQEYFGVPEGRLRSLNPVPRHLADHIRLIALGTKDQPSYGILDDGEGQQPDRFPSTFLSLLRDNKVAIPFVQGKYNMGGTGVLQFAGEHSFQLIISRRRSDLPPDGAPELKNHWGCTLVRRFRPGPNDPQSIYVYLAPDNEIPRFEAEALPLGPGQYPKAFDQPVASGTYIKLWNYKVPGRLKSTATLDMRYALERYLQEPGLPVRLFERRAGYTAHSYDTSMSGLAVVLANAGEDKEPGFDGGSPLNIPDIGEAGLELAVIKEEADKTNKRYPAGVFLNVNGQLHGQLGTDFFKRRDLKLDYVADSLVVRVDCTRFDQAVREDVFMPSRDRMRECPARWAIEAAIQEYLADHQGLRELNARRRQEALSSSVDEDTASVLQELVKSDPTLASLFGAGSKLKVPGGPLPEPVPFQGKRFPTYFRIAKEPTAGLVRRTPRNWTAHIEYETDAANDYFSPGRPDRGQIALQGAPQMKSVHLWNGKATLRFQIPASSSVGDVLRVEAAVMDDSRIEPFASKFAIEVMDEQPHQTGGVVKPHESGLSGIPNPVEVHQHEWAKFGFDQYSGVLVRHGDGDTGESLDIFINMDNQYLKNEKARRRALGEAVVESWFKYGLLVLSLGMLYRQRQLDGAPGSDDQDDDENEGDSDRARDEFATIGEASKGMAVTVVPLIAQLAKKAMG